MLGGTWVVILCHLHIPTWSTHTVPGVNNSPLQPSTCTTPFDEPPAEALQLYSALQRSTALQLYILLHYTSLYNPPQPAAAWGWAPAIKGLPEDLLPPQVDDHPPGGVTTPPPVMHCTPPWKRRPPAPTVWLWEKGSIDLGL